MELKKLTLISETLILAGMTALSYFYAFMFERAYLAHFGLSNQFVSLDINSLVLAAVTTGSLLALILFLVDFLMSFVSALSFGVYVEYFAIPMILAIQAAYQLVNFGTNLFTLIFAFFVFLIWIMALRPPFVAWWTGKKYVFLLNLMFNVSRWLQINLVQPVWKDLLIEVLLVCLFLYFWYCRVSQLFLETFLPLPKKLSTYLKRMASGYCCARLVTVHCL